MRLFQYGLTALALSSLLFATACDCKKEAVDENTPASAVVAEEQAAVADDAQEAAAEDAAAEQEDPAPGSETARPGGLQLQLGGTEPSGFGNSAPRLLDGELRGPE